MIYGVRGSVHSRPTNITLEYICSRKVVNYRHKCVLCSPCYVWVFCVILCSFHSFQKWMDESLKWDSSQYNGIRTLRVPATMVWLPDTFIFNKYVGSLFFIAIFNKFVVCSLMSYIQQVCSLLFNFSYSHIQQVHQVHVRKHSVL